MAEVSGNAEGPEPLVAAFMWGIRHSVCRLLISLCLNFLKFVLCVLPLKHRRRTEQHFLCDTLMCGY